MKPNAPDVRRFTGCAPNPRAPGFLIVEIDGARFASLPQEWVSAWGVRKGDLITEEQFGQLSRAAEAENAYRTAIRALTARPQSTHEMRRRLHDRDYRDPLVGEVLRRLEREGLLDDDKYARDFTRARIRKGHGAVRLISDLRQRGLDRELAATAVAETLESEGIEPAAEVRRLAEKRALQLTHVGSDVRRRRVIAYLTRRGYHAGEILDVVDEVLRAI